MKTKRNIQGIGIFNFQGLVTLSKQLILADDSVRYIMAVLCIQETYARIKCLKHKIKLL